MKKQIKLLALLIIFSLPLRQVDAQNTFPSTGAAGVGTTSPSSSSLIEVKSTTKGVLFPRMTKSQRDAINSPANGLLIYQTDKTPGFYYYDGNWKAVSGAKKDLSNLTSPTAINADFLPDANNKYDLGSDLLSWKNIHAYGNYYIGNIKVISYPAGNSIFLGPSYNTTSSGDNNCFVGSSAGDHNSTGKENTSLGNNSLLNNTTGNYNTASGSSSLYYNTSGYNNVANGYRSLYSNTTGYQNTAVGEFALNSNTTAYQNTAIGSLALYGNTVGIQNSACGRYSLETNSTGNYNTAIGESSLKDNTTGSLNCAVGDDAGLSNSSGNNNTYLGYYAAPSLSNLSNSTAIGSTSMVSASNQVRIGNPQITSIGGYVNWSNLSDGRVKQNIHNNVPGLDFINKLQPVTYNLNLAAADNILLAGSARERKELSPEEAAARSDKEKIVYSGFIAQDVEKAAKELGYDFSGVDAPKNENDLYGLRYSEFVVPLVKAVQELDNENGKLKTENDELKSTLENQQKQIDELRSMITSSPSQKTSSAIQLSSASLEQNSPNPFSEKTMIHCYVPSSSKEAVLKISSLGGAELKSFTLTNSGMNEVEVNGGTLSAGDYVYSLIIDGRTIDSKRMTLTR